jgi:hypothetical protein
LKVTPLQIDAFFSIVALVEKFSRNTKRASAFASVHEQQFSLSP